jgi:hypothetical protein
MTALVTGSVSVCDKSVRIQKASRSSQRTMSMAMTLTKLLGMPISSMPASVTPPGVWGLDQDKLNWPNTLDQIALRVSPSPSLLSL